MPNPKKPRKNCLQCGKEPARSIYIYCSNRCQQDYFYKKYIGRWKNGEITGLQNSLGIVSSYVKRYLRIKYNNQCSICGWKEINPYTQQTPLVADHIDGNWRNNVESNLRLICPNCDSLTATYAGLNRGNGRGNRKLSKRAQESRSMVNKPV